MTALNILLHFFEGWKGVFLAITSSMSLIAWSMTSASIPINALVNCLSFSLGCTADEWEVVGIVVGIVVALLSLLLQMINVFFIRRR